ncbi:20778_t:CDS:2 [Cetraspora pellucida]|uniref:20778_t:CDS:1 n=1 Tax=Cetraspora pellucida TaxID=1433469 RepID=A0A9N9FM84_9GLOM|nr:20778_t:CDS:2 [Cetraspora pellucida]
MGPEQTLGFTPLLKKQSPLLETFKDLIKKFKTIFGNLEKSRTAANKIRKLVQGTRPASSYISEFRQIVGNLDWGETVLINQFHSGLHSDVKDLLLIVKDLTLLNDTISKAVRCDNRLSAPFEEDPMQIDTIRIKPLLAAEKRQCYTNNLCFYCSDPGHIVKNCLKKSNLPPRINAIIFSEESSGKEQPQLQ